MSLSGTTNTYLPPTLDGLNIIEADEIYINGIPINTENLVPYTNATKNVNLGTFNFQTLGSITAKQHVFPSFGSTMMTGAMTSSIFYADAWEFNNTIQLSSLGGGAFLSTSYLRLADGSNNSTLLTLQSDGIADFANTRVRVSTMATNHYDVVNLSTLTSAVAFIENVNALNYLPYTGALQNLNMGGSTITTTGLFTAGTARFTSITSATPSLALGVDGSGNLNTFAVPITTGLVPYTGANATVNLGSQNLIANTARFSGVVSATPSFALGIDGSGNLNSFAVPSAGGTVNTSTTTARFLPYLSTATTLTNSLLNQIDNDSMGFGYTAIPNYPLGSAKNMYINGSIFAGGLNSMVGTFGRDTNTSNPANEITFVAGGAGVLLAQIKSHSGSSPFVDATWTYSNTNPAPLGANQGQVLLTAKNLTVSGIGNICAGNPYAVPNNYMQTGSLTIGDVNLNYGGGTSLWNSNTAGLMMECLDNTEIAVHDGGARVASMMYYTGNTITMGRNMGWGVSNVAVAGDFTMSITKPLHLYYNTPTNHAGILCEGSGDMVFFTGTGGVANRLRIASGGDITASNNLSGSSLIVNGGGAWVPGAIYSDVNHGMLFRARVPGASNIFLWNNSAGAEVLKMLSAGNMQHQTGDHSYMNYGPNATWNANLVVGASPDRANGNTAQVITTNGNLHMDAGNNFAMYYGFYANQRGTPNSHLFFGGNYEFNATPQNEYPYAHVACFFGDRLRRSQCMMREVYKVDYIAWGGGINMVAAFYKYNAIAPVKVSGKYSGYVASGGVLATMVVRIYSQSSGVFRSYPFITYQNLAYVQTTYPFELILSSAMIPETGWFDIYIYSSFALITDINNQLHVNVQLLPVDAF